MPKFIPQDASAHGLIRIPYLILVSPAKKHEIRGGNLCHFLKNPHSNTPFFDGFGFFFRKSNQPLGWGIV